MSKPSIVEVVNYVAGMTPAGVALTLSDVNTAVGIVVAVLTFVVNGVVAYRRDRREQRESDARLARHDGSTRRAPGDAPGNMPGQVLAQHRAA